MYMALPCSGLLRLYHRITSTLFTCPNSSVLLHWHWGNHMIRASLPQCQWSNPEEYWKNRMVPHDNTRRQSPNCEPTFKVDCMYTLEAFYLTVIQIGSLTFKLGNGDGIKIFLFSLDLTTFMSNNFFSYHKNTICVNFFLNFKVRTASKIPFRCRVFL